MVPRNAPNLQLILGYRLREIRRDGGPRMGRHRSILSDKGDLLEVVVSRDGKLLPTPTLHQNVVHRPGQHTAGTVVALDRIGRVRIVAEDADDFVLSIADDVSFHSWLRVG